MFFNVDIDNGVSITGWVAPENPGKSASVAILISGRDEIVVEARHLRADVRELGVHSTGEVGFIVDTTLVPDLETVSDIEIVEAETRTLVYRRFQPTHHIEKKIFLFESSLMPNRQAEADLTRRFTMNYPHSQRYSLETMLVIINNGFNKSIRVSGRSNFNRYTTFLDGANFLKAALLHNPFEEFAERLLFLNLIERSRAFDKVAHLLTGVETLAEFARDLPFNDPKALLAAFRRSTDEQRLAIRSPMVRMFGCNVEELPQRRHVAIALDNLASMDVVGTRNRYDAFRSQFARAVGSDVILPQETAPSKSVVQLAETLSHIGLVNDLLQDDIEFFALADEAIADGLDAYDPDDLVRRDTQTM